VSLLPDFCTPRWQYGPGVVGFLFDSVLVLRLSLLESLRRLRPEAERHSLVQRLLGAFVARRAQITGFLGGLRQRVTLEDVPATLKGKRQEAALLFLPLREGFPDGSTALSMLSYPFFERFHVGFL